MTSAHRRPTLLWLLALALVATVTTVLAPSPPARAFKPFTHVVTAWSAYGDVVDDGQVTLGGRPYPVDGRVVEALRDWPEFYQAGVIGPDGFPDLAYGQSVIHPDRTGEWIRHVLQRAWAFQKVPVISEAQKEQVLAFAYGFATHAAGDVWAHTLVNDLSSGIFPGIKEMTGKPARIAVALRHIIVEGYIGDATPGFDGNPDRTQVGSDVSDDASTQIAMNAPHEFVYDTFVNPRRDLPVGNKRGPLVDYFLDLEADLQVWAAIERRDEVHRACALIDPDCHMRTITMTVDTVRGPRKATYKQPRCEARYWCKSNELDDIENHTITKWTRQYYEAWVDDIERGLRHWSELGLAISRGLFDPQARRNLQNLECAKYGAESVAARENCENGITAKAVVLHEAEPFILEYLLPMMGLPDFSKSIIKALDAISGFLDKLVGPALNPLRIAKAELKKRADKFINDTVRDVFGVDLEMINSFLEHPSYWMNVDKVSVQTPAGRLTLPLFAPGTRDRLDALMGLTPADHHSISISLPDGQVVTESVLNDAAVARNFAVMDNATTLSKLLLLDGPRLNQVATEVLQGQGVMRTDAGVVTYPSGSVTNVMTHGLVDGFADAVAGWLRTADGDHNWREDGKPRFPTNDGGEVHGGFGTFPLWESCALRPVFRSLFRDWEHGSVMFPDDGDAVSFDATDPKAPTMKVQFLSPTVLKLDPFRPANSALFVGRGEGVRAVLTDQVFTDASLTGLWTRTWLGDGAGGISRGTTTGPTILVPVGGTDGQYRVGFKAFDPCHLGSAGRSTSRSFVLDQTGPTITVTHPAAGRVVDSDDLVTVRWDTDDGLGVGVDVADGLALLGSTSAGYDEKLDMFLQLPGPQTIDVFQPDELGNDGAGETQIELHATSESLRSNVERGRQQQMIPDDGLYLYLVEYLDAAVDAHASGDHALEEEHLSQVASTLGQQPGGIDVVLREVLLALVQDLIAVH